MSYVTCEVCGNEWDAECQEKCPTCLAKEWASYPGIIKDKHDPRKDIVISKEYTSILTMEEVQDLPMFLFKIASSGSSFKVPNTSWVNYYLPMPVGEVSGSSIPPGSSFPVDQLNGLAIYNAFGDDPHIFAVSTTHFEDKIRRGKFRRTRICTEPGCNKLRYPKSDKCIIHRK